MAKRAVEQKSSLILQFWIISVYARFWDRANAALQAVGEKRTGNLNELLWF